MTIAVGFDPINRANSYVGQPSTYVSRNSATGTGLIHRVQIYSAGVLQNLKVAAFTASGDNLTTRGYDTLSDAAAGLNTYNAPGDFTPFEIRGGDHIGLYYEGDGIDYDVQAGFPGHWHLHQDRIPCVNVPFISITGNKMSIYATGWQLGYINIGDSEKGIQNIQINAGDVWKQVIRGSEINIGDVWKHILS